MILILTWNDLTSTSKIALTIVLVGVEGLEFATSKMVKLIRKEHKNKWE